MPEPNFTLIDTGRAVPVVATVDDDRVRLSPAALRDALGWELQPQGLCKGDRCVPLAGHAAVVTDHGVDLAGFAALLARPLALDIDARTAVLGIAVADRATQLVSLQAPDFTLPDLNGRLHTLSDHRGKKVLVV